MGIARGKPGEAHNKIARKYFKLGSLKYFMKTPMQRSFASLFILATLSVSGFAQTSHNRYEVETLANPNPGKKDTREVNAILIFEKDGLRIQSRRSNEVSKVFKYTNIKTADHSFSKKLSFSPTAGMIVLSVVTGLPFFLMPRRKEKHWLVLTTSDDFAVLKIENDNYRLIRLELLMKRVEVADINEEDQ